MKNNNIIVITADEGKVFRRIADGQIYGRKISLGYSYFIGGVKLTEPHLDIPEDFEQIDDPELSIAKELDLVDEVAEQ